MFSPAVMKLNVLGVFERNTTSIRKIYGPIKEGSWRIRTNKKKNDTLRKPRTLKFIRLSGH
jgi:hypothetical protein